MKQNAVFRLMPAIAPSLPAPHSESTGPELIGGFFPATVAEHPGPDGARFVCAAQWPGRDRRDGYFIARRQSRPWRWALWCYAWDGIWLRWEWHCHAATTAQFATEQEAAVALLAFARSKEAELWSIEPPAETVMAARPHQA